MPRRVVEPSTWQALPAMCLVERSGFGLNALLGPKVGLGHGNTLLPDERELIKVASLEDDLVVAHMEETAPTQARWIQPFKNGPFYVIDELLRTDTRRVGKEC